MSLINSNQEIKRHNSAVSIDLTIESVQSFIDDGINRNIIPKIGRVFFNEIVDARDNLTSDQKIVFNLLQKSCIGFMMAYYSTSGALQISDAGISVLKGANNLPASDKKLMALKKESYQIGYHSLEQAVNYISESPAKFPTYQASKEHAKNRALLINNSSEFQESGVNIGYNAQLYDVLRIYQKDVESTYLLPLLGTNLRARLKTSILNNSLSEIEDDLLSELRKPVACFTLLEAIPYLAISLDSSGIYQLNETVGGISGNVENRTAAEVDRLSRAMYHLQAKGERQVETLRKWLQKNKDQFPEYAATSKVDLNDDPNSNIYVL